MVTSPIRSYAEAVSAEIAAGRELLAARYRQDRSGYRYVHLHARFMDGVLRKVWRELPGRLRLSRPAHLSLAAVGGYGRGELFPYSDIDLLFLDEGGSHAFIEAMLAFLWDIGLEVGHSVRGVASCLEEGSNDQTVYTSLLESRLLAGSRSLWLDLKALPQGWTAERFFLAKEEELEARYRRFGDTGYNLEPNLKEGPGGLRDCQHLQWLAEGCFGEKRLRSLIASGVAESQEIDELHRARNFLWSLRTGLHFLAGRREERLLFDHQKDLARDFGYRDGLAALGVEQLMKKYFRFVRRVRFLTSLLRSAVREKVLPEEQSETVPLDANFFCRGGYVHCVKSDVFQGNPKVVFDLYRHYQRDPEEEIKIAPGTVRSLHHHVPALKKELYGHVGFLRVLRHTKGVFRALQAMSSHGVLGACIPAYERITGQMQHDLFHVYTVNQHTLYLVRNFESMLRGEGEYASYQLLFLELEKPELLILAALFHDLGKGRGGDHSEIGAHEAARFCRKLGLNKEDTALVSWLVANHLVMSTISQRRDIEDPEVIREFAQNVGDTVRLRYLLLLTVADIRATNPKLWNSWKGQLLRALYFYTQARLQRGLDAPLDSERMVQNRKADALALIAGENGSRVRRCWQTLSSSFFLRYTSEELAWLSSSIIGMRSAPLVIVQAAPEAVVVRASDEVDQAPGLVCSRTHPQGGGTQVLVYAPNSVGLFARIAGVLDRLCLNIVDAKLDVTMDRQALDTFIVLDADDQSLKRSDAIEEMENALRRAIAGEDSASAFQKRRLKRQARYFDTAVTVRLDNAALEHYTLMELVAADRPGLLYAVGKALSSEAVSIQGAKVVTIGERAEDAFFLVDEAGNKLPDEQLEKVRQRVQEALENGFP